VKPIHLLLIALWSALPAHAAEIVVILDNSGSMVFGSKATLPGGETLEIPAADPDRLAVLGASAVNALGGSGGDRVTVIGFGNSIDATPPSTVDQPDLRDWPYSNHTYFRKPLEQALSILEASSDPTKVLILFTDGQPEDFSSVQELVSVFDPVEHEDIVVLPIGLFSDDKVRESGSAFLRAIARDPDRDFRDVDDPWDVVTAFTEGYARAIGSRPETGTLGGGATHTFRVGKYVSEVIVVGVSREPGDPLSMLLKGPGGQVPVLGQGDNGCGDAAYQSAGPDVCGTPRRHYQVFRSANDPEKASEWSLSLPGGAGKAAFGIILRYDLEARLRVADPVESNIPVPVEAELLFKGKPFDDEVFFGADGFEVRARIDGRDIPLTHAGGGTFAGEWTPESVPEATTVLAAVVFRNTWMQQTDARSVVIEPPPYTLVVQPEALALDPIPSRWQPEETCVELDLSASDNIDEVTLECTFSEQPLERDLTCLRTGPFVLRVCGSVERWCCEEEGDLEIRIKGPGKALERTSTTVPLHYHVASPGFVRCHWLLLLILAVTLLLAVIVYGFVRPHGFDESVTVAVAGSERGLRRANELLLHEMPGGRRGFYRNARACLTGGGDPTRSPGNAIVVLEAASGGATVFRKASGLEVKESRSRKWEPVAPEDFAQGYAPGVTYRVGDLFLRFE